MWHKSLCARVCIKHCCKAWLQELLSTWINVYQQSPQVQRGAHAHDPISRIKSAKQIHTWINRAKIIVECQQHQLADSRSWCGLNSFFIFIYLNYYYYYYYFFFIFPPHGGDIPMGTWRNNNVIMTSKRRRDVVLTSEWRYYCVACPLGLRACMSVAVAELLCCYVTVAVMRDICLATTDDCWPTCRTGLFLSGRRT